MAKQWWGPTTLVRLMPRWTCGVSESRPIIHHQSGLLHFVSSTICCFIAPRYIWQSSDEGPQHWSVWCHGRPVEPRSHVLSRSHGPTSLQTIRRAAQQGNYVRRYDWYCFLYHDLRFWLSFTVFKLFPPYTFKIRGFTLRLVHITNYSACSVTSFCD